MFFFIKTCETLKRKSCSGKDLMPYIILMHNYQVAYTKEQIATKHRITTHDQTMLFLCKYDTLKRISSSLCHTFNI